MGNDGFFAKILGGNFSRLICDFQCHPCRARCPGNNCKVNDSQKKTALYRKSCQTIVCDLDDTETHLGMSGIRDSKNTTIFLIF